MRWYLLIAMSASAAEPGYVDPAACRACHTKIYDSYQQTGMARSFSKATNLPLPGNLLHRASQRQYELIDRDGSYVLRRTPLPMEKRVDYVIGSGNHSKTLVHRSDSGQLIELPLSWYSEKSASWQMSPGYDRPDHSDFRREIADSCLFCHNGYPSQANGGLASGIDCQRCHGPGESHVLRKGPIVNPAKLPADRKLEVCLQCHLESASRTLPDSIRRLGRTPFSYRPGEPLSGFTLYFEFQGIAANERITVNGAGFGLLKSKCYVQSAGKLQCTTCHDPHSRTDATQTTRACKSCHQSNHAKTTDNCASCHMQKRRTDDAVHVVMTDHLIRRRPMEGDLLAMIPEKHGRLNGPVKPLYPSAPKDASLYIAMAQRDAQSIAKAIAEVQPLASEPYFALGEAWRERGRTLEAVRAFQKAAELDPNDAKPFVAAAEVMMARGEVDAAIELVEPAMKRMPREASLLSSLAVLYTAKERYSEAMKLLQAAVSIAPDDSVAWLNLGVSREAMKDRAGAIAAYERSLTLQPDLTRARNFLKRLTGKD